MKTKAFQAKRTVITCSCGNEGLIVADFPTRTLARCTLQILKNRLFNPNWKSHFNPPLDENEIAMEAHLLKGHRLQCVVLGN